MTDVSVGIVIFALLNSYISVSISHFGKNSSNVREVNGVP